MAVAAAASAAMPEEAAAASAAARAQAEAAEVEAASALRVSLPVIAHVVFAAAWGEAGSVILAKWPVAFTSACSCWNGWCRLLPREAMLLF